DSLDAGGALVAGDLVFTATLSGKILAFNRASGRQVWSYQAPGGSNGFITAAGDRLFVPIGLGATPMLLALKLGATGTSATATSTTTSTPTPSSSRTPSATSLCITTPNQGTGLSFNTSPTSPAP